MTNTSFTCDDFDAALSPLLEGDLEADAQGAAESHAAECRRCGSVLADVGDVRADAARLPLLRPSRDLWDGISARIEAPTIDVRARSRVREWQRPSRLAAAAVLLIAATATTTWNIARPGAGEGPAATETAAGGADAALSVRLSAAYDPEIAELRAILAARPTALDAATMQVVDENIRIIDEAIGRLRVALVDSPENAYLARQLARAYDTKLETLRRVVSMTAE
jgi:hypothetical protein